MGQSYDVTWTVTVDSPATGTPTGTVTVDDGAGNTCSAAVGRGHLLADVDVGGGEDVDRDVLG